MSLFNDGQNAVEFKTGLKVVTLYNLGPYVHPTYGESVAWECSMEDDATGEAVKNTDGGTYKFSVLTSKSMKSGSKGFGYAKAFLGHEPDSVNELEEVLTNGPLRCRAFVSKNDKGYPKFLETMEF